MEFHIDEKYLRVFAASISLLAKIGKDVYFEFGADTLRLHAMNDARSTYCAVTLNREYFSSYTGPERGSQQCKVAAKSLLFAFKSLKSVESLRMYFSSSESDGTGTQYAVFQFQNKHSESSPH